MWFRGGGPHTVVLIYIYKSKKVHGAAATFGPPDGFHPYRKRKIHFQFSFPIGFFFKLFLKISFFFFYPQTSSQYFTIYIFLRLQSYTKHTGTYKFVSRESIIDIGILFILYLPIRLIWYVWR